MHPQNTSKKTWIIIAAIVVAAVIAYFYWTGGSPSADVGLLQQQSNPEVDATAAQVLNLLNQIRSLSIDTAIFKDPAYQTLQDYSVAIPQENVGRPNPFAPLPGFRPAVPGASAAGR